MVPVTYMDSRKERGKRIAERREALGADMSVRALAESVAEKTPPFDRATLTKIENGDPSVRESNLRKVEKHLDALEYEMSMDLPDRDSRNEANTREVAPADFVEFELTVDAIGLHIIGKGTTANMAEVRKQVADLYREIRGDKSD